MLKYSPFYNVYLTGESSSGALDDLRSQSIERFVKTKSKLTDQPETLFIIPTYLCNIKCSYCYIDTIIADRNQSLTIKEFIKLYNSFDNSKVNQAIILGGESFYDIDLLSGILEILSDKNIYTNIITNGTTLIKPDNKTQEIVSKTNVSITLSIDPFGINYRGIEQYDLLQALLNLSSLTRRFSVRMTLHNKAYFWYETRNILQNIIGKKIDTTIAWGNFKDNILTKSIQDYLSVSFDKDLKTTDCIVKPLSRFISNMFPFNLGDCDAGFRRVSITPDGLGICCKPYDVRKFILPDICSSCDYLLPCGTQCWADIAKENHIEDCCKFIKLVIDKAAEYHRRGLLNYKHYLYAY